MTIEAAGRTLKVITVRFTIEEHANAVEAAHLTRQSLNKLCVNAINDAVKKAFANHDKKNKVAV